MTDHDRVNILLVDDQPGKLSTYEVILRGLGERLLTAGSAREALECLLKNEVAVVLVDVCMPELDGYELASLIRQHPRFQKTAIIFVSAVAMNDFDRLRGYECGGVDYVPVPIVPEILRAKVSVFAELYRKTRQLEALNRELEERVADRTAALEATTLELQEASRRKDEFLAMLAHELRNPLAPIRTAIHLLGLEGVGAEPRERARQIVQRQVDHMVRLVDDLLDVSRISRGVIALERAQVEVAEIVARAVEINRPLIDAQSQSLRVHVPPEPLYVFGDATRLAQAVGNVVQNASKFTPARGSITVTAGREGGQAVIRVRDSGAGIRREMLAKVFELFVQANDGDGHASSGLGLGLALVRRLVELHHGSAEAISDGPGTGTTVVVRLPLMERVDVPVPDRAPRDEALRSLPSRRVLVVDDNRDAADTLVWLLASAGHEARRAYDGPEALSLGAGFAPDVVLLDLGMPNLSGYDTARQIRKTGWGREAWLVAVTGWGQPRDRQRTRDAGFDLHLVKPVGDGDLARALALASRHAEGALGDCE